jgi:hypothetical protein
LFSTDLNYIVAPVALFSLLNVELPTKDIASYLQGGGIELAGAGSPLSVFALSPDESMF